MPSETPRRVHEILVAPLPLLLTETAGAVAQAQVALDQAAMHTQEQLDELTRLAQQAADPEGEPTGLARFQVDAPWYHFPEVEVDIALSLSVEVREESRGTKRVYQPLLRAMPYNARVQNQTNFDASGTSRLKARIMAVPPPQRPA
jgi:hypothetical protein